MATPTGLSFPSSHSTSSFAAARAFGALLPRAPLYCAAAAMALSRLYLGVHYPSDVAAGAALGTRAREPRADDEGRHRGDAQRGQVLALQRARRRPGARGGELPVHDDRAERRRRAGRRRAARRGGEDRRRLEHRAGHDRVPRHRRAWSPARTRARGSATSSWPTSARPTRCCTSCARTTTRTSSTPTAASTRRRDIETIETELIYADLEQAERRHARVVREARSGDRARDGRGGVAARR